MIISCKEALIEKGSPEYINEIKTWHQQRIENLKKPNGWLNLVGLYWLKAGENTFGSNPSGDVVFPEGKTPAYMGVLILNNGEVTIKVNPEVDIQSDGKKVTEMILQNDLSENTTVLTYGSLSWFVIKREDKIGIRLRDYEAELVKNFTGIETYPINEDWRIEAQFVPYNPPKKLSVPSIIGTISEEESYDKLVFEKDGDTYTLDPMGKDYLFLVFADETNGDETYGGGRFLSVDPPDSTGKTFIDFNKAYNPPCAFTKYATCPMPPKDNYLYLRVTAGEKKYGNH
ncbi:MAG: hypothetical protein A2V66_06230 [Ignavibacteria bacterium RBG_13_36_8]|nr:MAG: hypothetical protein A2V66_06230 [Ignavibacteria bacterium RBG_13_36_8]